MRNFEDCVEDYPVGDPTGELVKQQLGFQVMLVVPRNPIAPYGLCYWSVLECVQNNGGSIALGWMVEWIPNVLVTAMHHAVWLSPHGELLDVSGNKLQSPTAGHTTFIPDHSTTPDLAWPPCIESKHVILRKEQVVKDFVLSYKANNTAKKNEIENLRRAGTVRWNRITGDVPGASRVPNAAALSQKVERTWNEHQRNVARVVSRYCKCTEE